MIDSPIGKKQKRLGSVRQLKVIYVFWNASKWPHRRLKLETTAECSGGCPHSQPQTAPLQVLQKQQCRPAPTLTVSLGYGCHSPLSLTQQPGWLLLITIETEPETVAHRESRTELIDAWRILGLQITHSLINNRAWKFLLRAASCSRSQDTWQPVAPHIYGGCPTAETGGC